MDHPVKQYECQSYLNASTSPATGRPIARARLLSKGLQIVVVIIRVLQEAALPRPAEVALNDVVAFDQAVESLVKLDDRLFGDLAILPLVLFPLLIIIIILILILVLVFLVLVLVLILVFILLLILLLLLFDLRFVIVVHGVIGIICLIGGHYLHLREKGIPRHPGGCVVDRTGRNRAVASVAGMGLWILEF